VIDIGYMGRNISRERGGGVPPFPVRRRERGIKGGRDGWTREKLPII